MLAAQPAVPLCFTGTGTVLSSFSLGHREEGSKSMQQHERVCWLPNQLCPCASQEQQQCCLVSAWGIEKKAERACSSRRASAACPTSCACVLHRNSNSVV